MRFFDSLLLNLILLLFPLFIYLIYAAYQKMINKKNMDSVFTVALILSMFLMIKYGVFNENYYMTILLNVPLLLAYLKDRKILAILISIVAALYSILIFKINIIIILFEYLSYFFLYIISSRRGIMNGEIINNFTIVKSGLLSFLIFAFLYPKTKIWVNIFYIILSISTFYLITIICYKLFQKTIDIVTLNDTIKELEKEKTIRNSLFKITHEVKNPIAVCKGYLDMIDLNNKKKVDKYIPIIKSEINRTLLLLDDYLDFSRVRIEKDIIDIIMLIEDTLRSMGILLKEKNVNTNFQIIEEEVYMMADYNRLKQVLINIIKNSMEAKIDDQELTISVETILTKDNIRIIIKDDGIGMDKEELNKLGEAFYTTKANGTGIGVNLSKEIIEKHKGSLTYESKKYVGTTVTIDLPIDPELNTME